MNAREHEHEHEHRNDRDHDRDRRSEDATAAARRRHEEDRERAGAEPFDYPYPERRAGVRARRHISEAQAAADTPPGIPGGYGTTGGGQAGATGAAHPPVPGRRTTSDRTPAAEPGGDDEGPTNRSER
ncbi:MULTISPECIES: hypothetical protein [Streptomyces]|uniref:hypothetical protein n=1 Tax=Streptomyces TaxID=1883 RepID=UPI001675C121|nr:MULTISPECIES: hypothetical protein [Streptomyces]MBK3523114.1 hypothetical protein [Streptomyces sp. MBT70]GGS08196.1 hypothetical protein GCM10010236_73380 [Streptomyces eurythermus]